MRPSRWTVSGGGFNRLAGVRLYMQEHGDAIAGKKIEIVLKDDASVPNVSKRLAQELIVNDKVALLLGCITPSALTIAPLTAGAKIPNKQGQGNRVKEQRPNPIR